MTLRTYIGERQVDVTLERIKNLSRIDFQMSSPGSNILNAEKDNKKACWTSRKWFIKFMFMVCEAHKTAHKVTRSYQFIFQFNCFSFSSDSVRESFKEIDYFPHDRAPLIIPDFLADGSTAQASTVASINGALKWSIIMLHFNVLLILLSGSLLGSPRLVLVYFGNFIMALLRP